MTCDGPNSRTPFQGPAFNGDANAKTERRMSAILIDTEVNSFESMEAIEVAWTDWGIETGSGEMVVQRFRPENPIEPGAVAVHGILPDELAGKPPSSEAAIPADVDYIIGHNVDFDWQVLGEPDVKRICTMAIAKNRFPQFKTHKLGALLYEFYGLNSQTRDWLKNAHLADADVANLDRVLAKLIENEQIGSLEDLWNLSEECRIPTHMPFGKYRGEPISKVPADYKRWLANQDDVDSYLMQAITGQKSFF